MLGKLKELTMNMDGSQNLTVTIQSDIKELYDKLADKDVDIEIKKASKHRSMDANNYFWHLCGEVAKASSQFSPVGKNDIYREAIQKKGEWDALLVREDAVDAFIKRWAEKGTGWFAEVVDDYVETDAYGDIMGDKPHYKVVHVYYGSSTYDSASMARIIDYVVMMAADVGVPTMTENEKNKLLAAWAKKKGGDE